MSLCHCLSIKWIAKSNVTFSNLIKSLPLSSSAAGYILTLIFNPTILEEFSASFYIRVTAVSVLQKNIVALPTKNAQAQLFFPSLYSH